MKNQLWVEKYRPKTLNDLILNSETKKVLENISNNKAIF